MRKATLFLSIVGVFAINSCGSSGGGGTPGAAGSGGTSSGGTGGGAGGTTGGGGTGGSTGSGGTGGGLAACGTDDHGTSGDGCNTITPGGACVTAQTSNGTAPTTAGGTIVAGTYNLTSETIYGGDDSGNQQSDRRETLAVSGVTAASFTLDQAQASGTSMDRSHGTVVVTGTTVTYTPTCPPPDDGGDKGGSANFTATATTFTLIQSKNGNVDVKVYTKAP